MASRAGRTKTKSSKFQISNFNMAKRKATEEYVTVGKTSDVAPGTVRVIDMDGQAVAVANIDGQFYAFADVCTHDGGPVAEGELDGCVIECPRHGAHFDITTGKVLSMPAVVDLPVYGLRIEGDEIKISRLPR
jgi:3-phenylpropionate/trans-cinnamate dioxygenase ferredoxin subunit